MEKKKRKKVLFVFIILVILIFFCRSMPFIGVQAYNIKEVKMSLRLGGKKIVLEEAAPYIVVNDKGFKSLQICGEKLSDFAVAIYKDRTE